MNKFWTDILLILALAVSVTSAQTSTDPPPAAETPASREDIQALFDLMHVREQVGQVMESIARQQRTMIYDNLKRRTPRLTPRDLARLDQFTAEILKDLPIDGTVEDMIPIYQKHLNKSDVQAMAAFYASPTGQKLLREMPVMTIESMQAASPRIQALMDKVMERAAEMADEGKEQSSAPKPPANKQ